MKLDYKYTILYTLISILLFWMTINYGTFILNNFCGNKVFKEGLTEFERYSQKIVPYPSDAVIDYDNLNSPEYSHTVDLPINNPVSCKNFCGPKSQCLFTREQCTSDIDCAGCNPGPTTQPTCFSDNIEPYDATGKLGQNQGLNYSNLTTGYNNHNINFSELYPGSKNAQINKPYQGVNLWTNSFNQGLELYNKKRDIDDKYKGSQYNSLNYEPQYPMKLSSTGLFYETTPPASNASLTS